MNENLNRLIVFTLDARQYALCLFTVERVVRAVQVAPLLNAPAVILGLINVEGQIMPVMNMRKRFNLPMRDIDPQDQFIIANTSKRKMALWVDSVADVVEPLKQNVVSGKEILPDTESIKGAIILDDGMLLIYNLDRLLSSEEEALFDSLEHEA